MQDESSDVPNVSLNSGDIDKTAVEASNSSSSGLGLSSNVFQEVGRNIISNTVEIEILTAAQRRLLAVRRSVVCQQKQIQLDDGVDYVRYEEGKVDTKDDVVFSSLNAVLVLASTLTYAIDISSCAAVCYYLYLNFANGENPIWWFIVSIVSLLASLIIINGFSMRWYLHDRHEEKFLIGDVPPSHWGLRILFHVFLLGPVLRYVELLCYGLHSINVLDPKRKAYKVLVLQEDRDTALLSLVGSFIKSAPHLVLELYVMTQHKTPIGLTTTRAQIVAVTASVVTLSLSLTSYHRALRRSTPSKLNMTVMGSTLQFISHFCIIGCRVLALAAFASVYHHWFFAFAIAHWGVMSAWVMLQKTTFCAKEDGQPRKFDEVMFGFVIAIIYMFCFINVKDEPTRWKYAFYYVITLAENLMLVIFWYIRADRDLWYRLPLLLGVLFGFVTGLGILIVYYLRFHPNKVSKLTTYVEVLNAPGDENVNSSRDEHFVNTSHDEKAVIM